MREVVLAMTVVLADGRVIRTSRRSRKSSAGYDLTRLFVGSEGTLGVITDVTVRLFGIPESIAAAVVSFPDMESAVNAVILDEVQVDAINDFSGFNYPLQPTLILEFHGSEAGVHEQTKAVHEICDEFSGSDFRWATKTEERAKLWQARHDAYYACIAKKPGKKGWATDVCVPISRLAECILETRQDLDNSFIYAPMVGHAGDGNFHLVLMIDPEDSKDMAEAKRLNDRLVHRALAMDGTCTGEHGIGYGKVEFLNAEHGEAVSVMRSIKVALDPKNIMNPGKIVCP